MFLGALRSVVPASSSVHWSLLIRWAQRLRCQAETPLIVLFRILSAGSPRREAVA